VCWAWLLPCRVGVACCKRSRMTPFAARWCAGCRAPTGPCNGTKQRPRYPINAGAVPPVKSEMLRCVVYAPEVHVLHVSRRVAGPAGGGERWQCSGLTARHQRSDGQVHGRGPQYLLLRRRCGSIILRSCVPLSCQRRHAAPTTVCCAGSRATVSGFALDALHDRREPGVSSCRGRLPCPDPSRTSPPPCPAAVR
jgi:hypothetical protein